MIENMDALAQAGVAFGVIAGGVFTGWQARQTRREAQQTKHEATAAREQAERAAENAHPISNGWGTALRRDMAATRQAVERIAEAQLLSERRELQRDARLERMDQRLQDHINEKGTRV